MQPSWHTEWINVCVNGEYVLTCTHDSLYTALMHFQLATIVNTVGYKALSGHHVRASSRFAHSNKRLRPHE